MYLKKEHLVILFIIWGILLSGCTALWLTIQITINLGTRSHYIAITMCIMYFAYVVTVFRINEMSDRHTALILAQNILDIIFGVMTGMIVGLAPSSWTLPQIICVIVLGSIIISNMAMRAYDMLKPDIADEELVHFSE